jgi:glycosyltransferase involved in cell wall biosynthesis
MRKKIAFIKKGRFSHTNTSVGTLLVKFFPDHEVEFIDIRDLVEANRPLVWANRASILRNYGLDIATRQRTLWECFYHTPYMFRKVKELVQDIIGKRKNEFSFTFQTQSLYDASVPGLPHFIYTDHTNLANLHYEGFGEAKIFPTWNPLEKLIYQNATKIFTMSEHVRHSLIDQYQADPNKVTCIQAGCNLEFKPIPLQNDNYRNKNILFVGVEWERKGGLLLVEAFKTVLKKHPDARLTIVGCSPKISVQNCEIIGQIPLEEVRQHYAKASVFCLPTRIEPFGIVFIESMLYRIPVVAPRLGALPDFVENNKSGRLVSPNNVDELAECLIDLLNDPEKCKRLGDAGYDAVKDRYSWDAVGARIKQNIAEVISQPLSVNP